MTDTKARALAAQRTERTAAITRFRYENPDCTQNESSLIRMGFDDGWEAHARLFPAAPARQDAPAGILTFVVDQESETEWDVNVWMRTTEPTLSKLGELIGWFPCESRQDAERVCERFKRLYSDVSAKQSLPDSPTPDLSAAANLFAIEICTILTADSDGSIVVPKRLKHEIARRFQRCVSNLGAPGAQSESDWANAGKLIAELRAENKQLREAIGAPRAVRIKTAFETDPETQEVRVVVKSAEWVGAPGAGQAGSADDADLFNFYTRLNRGYIFSTRMRIVKAMQEAMLAAEAKESPILSASPSEPKAAPELTLEEQEINAISPGTIKLPKRKAAPEKCPTCGYFDTNSPIMGAGYCRDPFHKAGTAPTVFVPEAVYSERIAAKIKAGVASLYEPEPTAPSESPRHVVFTDGMDDQSLEQPIPDQSSLEQPSESPEVPTRGVPAKNFMQSTGEGICFAHGPFKNANKSAYCPKWPACETDPKKAEFIAMGSTAVGVPAAEAREPQSTELCEVCGLDKAVCSWWRHWAMSEQPTKETEERMKAQCRAVEPEKKL